MPHNLFNSLATFNPAPGKTGQYYSLAALEKANGRPFKLSGFSPDGIASVLGWEGGALASLPGDCKIGVRLVADRKAPEAARNAVAGERELPSSDGAIRAVKPTVSEILIGY